MFKRILTCTTIILCVAAASYLPAPAQTDGVREQERLVARGKQLVAEGNCNYCHTPNIETAEGTVPDPGRTLSGHPSDAEQPGLPEAEIDSEEWIVFLGTLDNTTWAGPWGIAFSPNLTPDPGTGIGKWSEEIFIETMRSGKHVSLRRNILPPMPREDYASLSDRDLKAVFAYLMTLKPVVNAVPRPVPLPKTKSGDN